MGILNTLVQPQETKQRILLQYQPHAVMDDTEPVAASQPPATPTYKQYATVNQMYGARTAESL